jgi:hypothetical protein
MRKSKLVGRFVTEKLSGKSGIIVEKKKGDKYIVRIWVKELSNWVVMNCPKSQFDIGVQQENKIGFK